MNERIQEIRKYFGLSQRDFAKRIDVGQSTLAMFETGDRQPREIHINRICTEFGINKEWLRTGEGEMFPLLDRQDQIAKLTTDLFKKEKNSFKERLILALAGLDESEWEMLEKIAEKIAKEKD